MTDDDLAQVLNAADETPMKKFGQWFDKNFDCNDRKGKLVCEIEGEKMKIPNSVRQNKFDEDNREEAVRMVKKNHEVNKGAGLTFD